MQFIEYAKRECPGCGGQLEKSGADGMWECPYCGKKYYESAAVQESPVQEAPKQPFDRAKLIQYTLEQVLSGYSSGHIIPDKLNNDNARYHTARSHLAIPASAHCFLLVDSTMLGSGKRGLALCKDGIYFHANKSIEANRPTYYSWEQLSYAKLRKGGGLFFINGYQFDLSLLDAMLIFKILKEIQHKITIHTIHR